MSGQGQGAPGGAPPPPVQNTSHLHHRSWGSDDWQRLLTTHFGGADECFPPSDVSPLLRLTSDGTMLTELLQTLETGDAGAPLDPSAPLFSDETINAILGEQLRETAAKVAIELAQQAQDADTAAQGMQQMGLQPAPSSHSASPMMSLQEATAAMHAAHAAQNQPLPVPPLPPPSPMPSLPASMTHQQLVIPSVLPQMTQMPHLQQQQQPKAQQQPVQQQQYVTLLDGRVLQQADGSAVLARLPAGQQSLSVTLPGSNSVLQYIPVLSSQVVSMPQQQEQQQQQQLQHNGRSLPTISGSPKQASPSAVLPTSSSTPPATTPTSAAAATAAVYISELSTTQQLVAAAAAQQQQLQQQAAVVQLSVPQTANAAMAEAVAAVAEFNLPMQGAGGSNNTHKSYQQQQKQKQQQTVINSSVASAPLVTQQQQQPQQQQQQQLSAFEGGSAFGSSMSLPLPMAPPSPRMPRYASGSMQLNAGNSLSLGPPSLTPQLRPASGEPFPSTLTSAVVASALANSRHMSPPPSSLASAQVHSLQTQQQAPSMHRQDSGAMPMMVPTLRPVADMPQHYHNHNHQASGGGGGVPSRASTSPGDSGGADDGLLPRKPSHKRERSLYSATPALADPTTAPIIKCSKGGGGGVGTQHIVMGTSPDSCLLGSAAVARSGDASPLHNNAFGASGSLPLPDPPMSTPPPGLAGPMPSGNTPPPVKSEAMDAGVGYDLNADVAALMQTALAPKPGKRRGRPPGRTQPHTIAAVVGEPREPSDAEILEHLLREDPARRQLPGDEIKKLVRREKNRISAAISRTRVQQYTAALESRVRTLQAEQAELYGWLQAPPQALPHRVLLVGPAAAAAAAAVGASSPTNPRPPVRHLSL